MKSKMVSVFAAIIGLAAGFYVFLNLYPEDWIKEEEKEVTLSRIQERDGSDYTGHRAAKDIPRVSGKEAFEDLLPLDAVTVEPTDIVATGVYHLKAWADPYRGRAGTARHRRKKEVIKGPDLLGDYNQYYLVQCSDKSYILAQIPERYVKAMKKGEKITLPIGQKQALPQQAKTYLSDICQQYDASVDGVLYTFDDEWYKEHSFSILLIRIGAGAAVFFVVGVVLLLLGDKLFCIKDADIGEEKKML